MALGALKTLNASETEPRIRDLQGDFVDPVEGSPLADLREAVAEMRSQWRGTARWLRDEAGLRWLPEDDLYHAAGRNYINALSVVTDPAMEHMRALLGKSDVSAAVPCRVYSNSVAHCVLGRPGKGDQRSHNVWQSNETVD
ncbi:hypothetical protein ONE63_010317 [Megalurothrips usitatus]|uniref:Uncharacterized protein n=1 Tax=Megalurothrips usitatus TaxID=439358 RepID=A0AAV7XLL3_9NEOP|nr:hypothetical protein ONE63_010317 [Megalurothrips usitatus]